MEIRLYGYESPRELLAIKAAIDVLIANPVDEDAESADVDDRVEVPAIPEPKPVAPLAPAAVAAQKLTEDALVHDIPAQEQADKEFAQPHHGHDSEVDPQPPPHLIVISTVVSGTNALTPVTRSKPLVANG